MSELFVSDSSLPDSPDTIYREYLKFYPHLVQSRCIFLFKEKATVTDDRPVIGKVAKANPVLVTVLQSLQPNEPPVSFVFTFGWDAWNVSPRKTKEAWVDQLMAMCWGEEDDKTGDIKFRIRNPSISVFPEILKRHGTEWDSSLAKLATLTEAEGVSLFKGEEGVAEALNQGFFGDLDEEGGEA
jgi:hypothetical protein